MSQPNLESVDWTKIPAPEDDGAASHLLGAVIAPCHLRSTEGTTVELASLTGRTVLFVYPMTGQPGVALPYGWDDIPGARGCTLQACRFRDLFADLKQAGASHVFGLSVQSTEYQKEAAERLHLPFPLLSDADLRFATAMRLPTMNVDGKMLLKRLALVIDNGAVTAVFYPVFPPDRNAGDVLSWLKVNA